MDGQILKRMAHVKSSEHLFLHTPQFVPCTRVNFSVGLERISFLLRELTSASLVHYKGVAAERKNLFLTLKHQSVFVSDNQGTHQCSTLASTQLLWCYSDYGEKHDFCRSLGQSLL